MSTDQTSASQPATTTDKLQRQLDKLLANKIRQRKNEDVIRKGKNGVISCERIRTDAVVRSPADAPVTPTDVLAANNFPDPPDSQENGKLFDPHTAQCSIDINSATAAQRPAATALDNTAPHAPAASDLPPTVPITFHEQPTTGNLIDADDPDPLEDLLSRALSRPRRGHPAAFDDHSKGKLVALLSVGMSLRQAATVLGVSHTTIRNTLKADAALAEEITAARFQAQLQPLACVIREARRSWKAATWLLKYLDGKISSHEETPDERRLRQQQETDEFFAHTHSRQAKSRHTVG